MCGLCGALGASQYWTDAAGNRDFQENGISVSRRDEREARVGIINKVLHAANFRVRDWGGNSYVLEGPRGKLENVYNLSGIWSAVDKYTDDDIDPLDPSLLAAMEKGLV